MTTFVKFLGISIILRPTTCCSDPEFHIATLFYSIIGVVANNGILLIRFVISTFIQSLQLYVQQRLYYHVCTCTHNMNFPF